MKPIVLLLWIGACGFLPRLEARTFSVPHKQAAADSEVIFPIYLDDAGGAALIQVQLNYDPGFIDFVGFETGTGLGSQFNPTAFAENGVLTLIWTRTTALASGSGTLGLIRFHVNAGAENGTTTPLTFSNHETTDETGVVEYSLSETIEAVSGSLTVSIGDPDSDNDGMPDSWETTHDLNPLVSNNDSDTDHDGRTDFLEYAFGGNPRLSDPERNPVAGSANDTGTNYLTLTFHRRYDANLIYRVWESPNLYVWNEIPIQSNLLGSPSDQGDGTERITVRSSFQIGGPGASQTGFMKVEAVEP